MKSSRQKVATTQPWTAAAFMTSQPITIGRKQSLATAHHLMRANGVRHLPVLEHGDLVGILSQRDLFFLETMRGVDLDVDTVEDAMSGETYSVSPDAPLAGVARHMARKRYGCAVVIERGRVAGIFTATDALRILADVVPDAKPVARPAARRPTA
jgi:acetoin utilization protein AcuB